jgi:hypothetical protein
MMLFIVVCGTLTHNLHDHHGSCVCRDLPGGTFFKWAPIYAKNLAHRRLFYNIVATVEKTLTQLL